MSGDPALGPSPFATVREMYVVKDVLLVEMRAMEDRLTARIEGSAREHERHHGPIDALMEARVLGAKFRAGQMSALSVPLRTIEALNRYRWLIAIAIGGVAFLTERIKIVVMP